jgi:hypothetical protein
MKEGGGRIGWVKEVEDKLSEKNTVQEDYNKDQCSSFIQWLKIISLNLCMVQKFVQCA